MIDYVRKSNAHIFVDTLGERITIVGDDHHHLSRVMRLSKGDLITAACNNEIRQYVIEEISREKISASASRNKIYIEEESITLVVSLFKLDRLESGIAKAVESGATKIVIGPSERSSITLDSTKKDKVARRINSIVLNASMQSRRAQLPQIEIVESIIDFLREVKGKIVVCDPSGTEQIPTSPLTVVIGPEGGFSQSEIEEFAKLGQAWNISPYILRAETAMAVVPALINA